ncbi:MAG: hypothetical protein ABH862_03335, partial [Candidatus Omnitrophota bacterium]
MGIAQNRLLIRDIDEFLLENIPVRLGVNKRNELVRLVYEISHVQNISVKELFKRNGIYDIVEKGKSDLFSNIKKTLLDIRYPSLSSSKAVRIMPLKIKEDDKECTAWKGDIDPGSIFVERSVRDNIWTGDFIKNFPNANIVEVDDIYEKIKKSSAGDSVKLYDLRRDNVFIVKARNAFIKICPCTKKCVRCGYRILNIGFGCPVDCSYCYLQTYSNAPGLILPANIEDYYSRITELDNKAVAGIRIG